MSLGPSDPCRCGSGKKFKKCCMISGPRLTLGKDSPAVISERIAYMGQVGSERRQWCEQYLTWKTDMLDQITADQKRIESESGHHISCSNGCSACCSQHVATTLQECEAIVYWLHLHPGVRSAFIERYSSWRTLIRKNHEVIFQEVSRTASLAMQDPENIQTRDTFLLAAQKYLSLDIPCPFLDNGLCTIYPVRPFVCACHVVTSPPEDCKASSANTPLLLLGAIQPSSQPSYFRGPSDLIIYSPAPIMVYEIIVGGYIKLNDIPGLAGLENEAFRDPQIRALFQG